jgi:hypothetical protein
MKVEGSMHLITPSFLLLLAAAGPVAAVDEPDSIPVVTLYLGFEERAPGTVLAEIKKEVNQVLAPAGVRFDWRSLDDPRSSEPVHELVVIKFKGLCDIGSDARVSGQKGALGWTHISDGALLPFSDIDCSRTWAFIRQELLRSEAAEQERALGRALGRVLAHELYHVFANTTSHTIEGVAKA